MSTYTRFFFRPSSGEQVSTAISLGAQEHSAVCGRVTGAESEPVEDALVLLFRVAEDGAPELLSQFCTDSDGHFIFGPLEGEVLYLIKVFKNNLKLRELEIRAD